MKIKLINTFVIRHPYIQNLSIVKKTFVYSLLAGTCLLSACSTDLDVIGDYKETTVVYGLLDQSQAKQYIKINKAFLGKGNALEFAQIKDSTQYANSLSVVLKRMKNGAQVGADIPFSSDNTVPKNSGVFYSPDQANAIFSSSTPLFTDSEYKLVIKNTETGNEVTSQTPLVNDFNFTKPSATNPSFSFTNPPTNPNPRFFVEWNTAKNARTYQLVVRLYYTDSTISSGNVAKYLDWVFPSQKTQKLDGSELPIGNDFHGQDFFQYVGSQLSTYPDLFKRTAGNIELRVIAAADDLNTFIEVNAPSTGIIQQKPEFTNITNGLGVFSSRYNKAPFAKPMTSPTIDTLACGQYTKNLKFLNALKQVNGLGEPKTCP